MSGESRDSGHGVLVGMDSSESRWVFQDEDENGEDLLSRVGLDSEEEEEEENGEQRLIRTGPRIDSFDVEALEVPGAQRIDYEDFSMGRKIVQAFQTLGVVFGDVGTSPLYTFGVMFNKSPIHGEEDVLGALSLVLFTLILIPLIKYVLVVLWANDDGEGTQRLLTNSSCLITSGYMHLDVLRIAILDIMADSTIICCLALMYDNNMSTPICYAFVVVQKVRTVLARMLSSLHLQPIISLIASMKQGHINLKINLLIIWFWILTSLQMHGGIPTIYSSAIFRLVAIRSTVNAPLLILSSVMNLRRVHFCCFVTFAGGTFALYSLICRHAKVSLLPNQLPSDSRISSFRLKVPSAELERSLKVKERLETSQRLKKLLLMLVLAGTSMVIADGVVTPTMSVMSAVSGLKLGISGVRQDDVVMISVAFLVILFIVQRFGTSKVGLAVGPALFIWFCSLGGIGIYNLVKYDRSVLRAFNPIHIYYFFKRNSTEAWLALGGCLLCATGSEAMFADLCYFSVRSVQLTFLFLVLPCLLLGYLGQAAFLMENQTKSDEVFFSSIPSGAFWPVLFIANIAALIASRTMTTATFSCIKQSIALGCFPRLKIVHTSRKFMGQIYIPVMNWFLLAFCLVFVTSFPTINELGNAYGIAELGVMMVTTILVTIVMLLIWQINIIVVLSFLVCFLGIELVFFSSVLWSVGDGSWIILVFAAVIFFIMFIWNYGSKLKYETEVKQKLSMDLLLELGSDLGTVRAPGIGLVYNELAKGVPAIFGHFLTTLPAIHSMIIFVCIKYVPVSVVPQNERFLFRRVCPRSYHIFRCIARYGYKDVRKENHATFEQLLIESLEKFIRREAQERSLESDDEYDVEYDNGDAPSKLPLTPNGSVCSLGEPLLADYISTGKSAMEASTSSVEAGPSLQEPMMSEAQQTLERELSFIHKAKESGMVYLLGHGDIRARKDSWFFKKLVINYFYSFLRRNCRRGIATLSVPHTHLMQVGMTYMV